MTEYFRNEEALHHITFSTLILDYEKFTKNKPMNLFNYKYLNYGLNDGVNFSKHFLNAMFEKVKDQPILKFKTLEIENKRIEKLNEAIFIKKVPVTLYKNGNKYKNGLKITNGE